MKPAARTVKTVRTAKKFDFIYNPAIDLPEPELYVKSEQLNREELEAYHMQATQIAGEIPDKINELDKKYEAKRRELEENQDAFFRIVQEMNEISEAIGKLNALYFQIQGDFIQVDRPK